MLDCLINNIHQLNITVVSYFVLLLLHEIENYFAIFFTRKTVGFKKSI